MKELREAMALIRRWHKQHMLPVPGLVFVYPETKWKFEAENAYKLDMKPYEAPIQYGNGSGMHSVLEGITFTFDHQQKRYML